MPRRSDKHATRISLSEIADQYRVAYLALSAKDKLFSVGRPRIRVGSLGGYPFQTPRVPAADVLKPNAIRFVRITHKPTVRRPSKTAISEIGGFGNGEQFHRLAAL